MTSWNTYIAFLYICVSLILMTIFSLIYISYSERKQESKPSWTVYVCKNLLFLFMTIFYYPIFEYLLSLMDCQKSSSGIYFHHIFKNQECWNSLHLLHSIIVIIICVVYVIFCMIVGLVYFESKTNTRDYNAKFFVLI